MNDEAATRPNKSARKREIAALHKLAEQMLTLSDTELARLGVLRELRDALAVVRPMKASGARNRQLKHCVKLVDPEALTDVVAYLHDQRTQRVAANRAFHDVERWRERLIEGGDEALSALLEQHPEVDRQQLRQLCRDAAREAGRGESHTAARKLFRFLRDQVFGDNT